MKWMVIDMTHSNALITNAMLASYVSEKNITYLQMIEPFIIYYFPSKIDCVIDIAEIASKVYEEFGLDIKSKVVEKVLLNLSKDEGGKKARYSKNKSGYVFYVNKVIDNKEFDNKRNFMKSLAADVVKNLVEYINTEENLIKKINSQEAQQILIDFLNNYNADIYNNIENIEKIKQKESILSNNYKVAKFIIREHSNELGCFDKIKQIQEGYFASIALYNFCQNIDDDFYPKETLKDTYVILDTMLLVDALKLDTQYKADSMDELLSLIHDNGGMLYTFDYYLEELCGIIEKYASDSDARVSLNLDSFRRKNLSIVEILLLSANFKEKIKSNLPIKLPNGLEVNIFPSVDYDKLIESKTWHIDALKLENTIKKHISYTSEVSFRNDYSTIERVLYEKEYNNLNIIFLSSNCNLIFSGKVFSTEHQKLFYTDIDLASTIWLSNYNSKSKLSELTLLQNAYAALTPTKEILDEVLQIIENNLDSSDEELRNNALLLRYDKNLLYHISTVVKNDKNNINSNIQNELYNSLCTKTRDELKDSVVSEVKDEFKNVEQQYKKLANELNKKDTKINVREERLNRKENDLQNKERILEARDTERKELKTELWSVKQELLGIKDNIKKRNHKIASIISLIIKFIGIGVIGVIAYILSRFLLIYCITNLTEADNINNIYQICTYVSFLTAIASTFLFYFKIIIKIARKGEDIFYDFLCKHSKYLKEK